MGMSEDAQQCLEKIRAILKMRKVYALFAGWKILTQCPDRHILQQTLNELIACGELIRIYGIVCPECDTIIRIQKTPKLQQDETCQRCGSLLEVTHYEPQWSLVYYAHPHYDQISDEQ